MPYFVFAMRAFGQFDKLGEFAAFRDASAHAKALRATQSQDAPRIKVMFGDTQLAAEDQLLQLRQPLSTGDDD